jgi:hypothetical protein
MKDEKKKPKKEKKDKDDGILGTGLAEKARKNLRDRKTHIERQLEDALK